MTILEWIAVAVAAVTWLCVRLAVERRRMDTLVELALTPVPDDGNAAVTGNRPPLRIVPPVQLVWAGAADVLQTATDARAELDRLKRERPSPHGDEPTNQRGDRQGHTPLLGRAISKSRARKARWHNRIGAAVGVILLIVCLVIVILAAAGIPGGVVA